MEVGSSIDGIVGEDVEGVDCELNKDRNESIEPKVGMKFDSVEDLHSLFKSYARLKGFGIRKRSSTKDEDGVSKYVRSFSKTIPVTSSFEMEKQVQSAYTISKFKEFQNELNSQMYCRIVSTRKEGTTSVYEIKERILFGEGVKKKVIFNVSYKSDEGEIECSCHMFEYKGTLCKHVIYVLVENEVELLPEKYILHRWRKDVRRPHTRIIITDNGWVVTPEQKRYDEMCIAVTEIADLAAMDEEDSREVMEWVSHQKNKLTKRKSRSGSNNPSPITSSSLKPRKIIYNEEDPRRINVQDPEVSKI
ncbi:zinc finger protein [Macleaya cordata]|uniref:Protein FAR1-RELATED SEQUENCE n=1 Tax=Macleaya cordata TaxID=56857 RepID=A0A200QVE7_MACCD|nr:zinc finger protein [Macleaya cordata]